MSRPYLEVTFRRGKPVAAYLYFLPRTPGATAAETTDEGHGVHVDLDASGHPIGIEITAPGAVTPGDVNAVLARFGLSPLPEEDWAPLRAA